MSTMKGWSERLASQAMAAAEEWLETHDGIQKLCFELHRSQQEYLAGGSRNTDLLEKRAVLYEMLLEEKAKEGYLDKKFRFLRWLMNLTAGWG